MSENENLYCNVTFVRILTHQDAASSGQHSTKGLSKTFYNSIVPCVKGIFPREKTIFTENSIRNVIYI